MSMHLVVNELVVFGLHFKKFLVLNFSRCGLNFKTSVISKFTDVF